MTRCCGIRGGTRFRGLGSGYSKDEYTRPDKWWTAYAGKSYVGSSGDQWATELMSSGAEYLFGDPEMQAKIWEKDPESARFFLGLMAGA